jgi:UPF0755 protein
MRKGTVFFLSLIIILVAIFGAWFFYELRRENKFDTKKFTIEKGETVNDIADKLEKDDIIDSKFVFEMYIRFEKKQGNIQAGEYVLTPMNIVDLVETFSFGKLDNEINLTIIEGWSTKDIISGLEKNGFSGEKFLAALDFDTLKSEYLFLEDFNKLTNLEGFIFPDTYRVYKDSSEDEIIKKIFDNFAQKITPAMLTEIKSQNKNLYDILKMASIIEMEVPDEEDRRIVSGLLWKRLDQGMLLQVDSSLKYEIGKKNKNSLTFEELKIDSPYNTYKYSGLPPTPIGNPGMSAIRAAIYSKKSDYWFYLSDKEGNTIFSRNLDEHNANIRKYLK